MLAHWPLVSGLGGQSRVYARIKNGASLVPGNVDIPTPVDNSSSDRRHTASETKLPYLRRSCFAHFYTVWTLIGAGTCVALAPSWYAKRATHPFRTKAPSPSGSLPPRAAGMGNCGSGHSRAYGASHRSR